MCWQQRLLAPMQPVSLHHAPLRRTGSLVLVPLSPRHRGQMLELACLISAVPTGYPALDCTWPCFCSMPPSVFVVRPPNLVCPHNDDPAYLGANLLCFPSIPVTLNECPRPSVASSTIRCVTPFKMKPPPSVVIFSTNMAAAIRHRHLTASLYQRGSLVRMISGGPPINKLALR